ncbi:MAG: thermonuclease family protein [Xenococcus sp. (in: cyanobacteria)]
MEIFNAKVTSVTDGDTVRVQREPNSEEIRIRFGGIDTPETNQRHGREATKALERLVLDQDVRVEVTGKRSGARMIGEIFVPASGDRPEVDVSLELVKAGHAWFFWQFANENLSRAKILAEAEIEAKFNRRGLFAERDPIYPRIFRSGGRIPNEVIRPEPEIVDNEVRILELVPNPSGQDAGEEKFIIGNGTSLTVSIEEWTLQDDDGGRFVLKGELEPNSSRTFVIINSNLVLNNNGDNLTLQDADGTIVQTISYGSVEPGEIVKIN